jgi:hypothetical protein
MGIARVRMIRSVLPINASNEGGNTIPFNGMEVFVGVVILL